jgi:hypothetical protein
VERKIDDTDFQKHSGRLILPELCREP